MTRDAASRGSSWKLPTDSLSFQLMPRTCQGLREMEESDPGSAGPGRPLRRGREGRAAEQEGEREGWMEDGEEG